MPGLRILTNRTPQEPIREEISAIKPVCEAGQSETVGGDQEYFVL